MPVNEWTKDELGNMMEFAGEETVTVPGCDAFIIGMTGRNQFIYDWRAIIADLQSNHDMDFGEAMEWFDHNIDIYPSDQCPVFQHFFVVKSKKRDKFIKTYGKNVGAILI